MTAAALLVLLAAGELVPVPVLTRPVIDLAGVLSERTEKVVSDTLEVHRRGTGVQIAVLTIDTTGGEPIEDFSMRVATAWGGGVKRRDDGMLFVIAVNDHRMRIEVGYGLEARVSDGAAKRLLVAQRELLKAGDYDGAVAAVVEQLIEKTAAGAMSPEERRRAGTANAAPTGLKEAQSSELVRGIAYFVVLFGFSLLARRIKPKVTTDNLFGVMMAMLAGIVVVGTALGLAGFGWLYYWAALVGIGAGALFLWEQAAMTALYLGLLVAGSVVARVLTMGMVSKDVDVVVACVFQAAITYFFWASTQESEGGSTYGSSRVTDRHSSPFSSFSAFGSSSFGSSSDSSSSSSSSSTSSDYSGGGGSFGGGGASSSW